MKKFFLVLVIVLFAGLLLAVGGGAGLYFWAARDLPGFRNITDYNPPLASTVYTADNQVLGYFYKEKRFLIPLGKMVPILPKAFLASEDNGFYSHEGVDIPGIFRAAFKNMVAGEIVQGGSTITQQVIKSLLLTPERSYARKIKEAILAYRLEKYLSKDEILTIYLNQIFFGAGAYGVEAAAREYFGVHASELSLAQAALLAGLPKAPSRYNPYKNSLRAIERQHYVLKRLLELGWIGQDEYDKARQEELVFKRAGDPSWQQGAYYLEEVRRRLLDKYGEDVVYKGGLTVRTGIRLSHQLAAEAALRNGLRASTKRRGWHGPIAHLEKEEYKEFLSSRTPDPDFDESGMWFEVLVKKVEKDRAFVLFGEYSGVISLKSMSWARTPDITKATENVKAIADARTVLKSGDVVWASVEKSGDNTKKADKNGVWNLSLEQEPVVEGALVSLDPRNGQVLALVGGYDFYKSQFNRATQAKRQPGSAFKPIVYSTALDHGFTAASVVLDAPIVYDDVDANSTWKPQNFEGVFYGPTILRTALVKSRNLVTIRIAQDIGIKTIVQRAKAMGLNADFPIDLSVSLGSVPVTPLNLCQAYTSFARIGTRINSWMISNVTDAWGIDMYIHEEVIDEPLPAQTAYIITNLLQQVVKYGTGRRARAIGRPVAGKTGTTNNEQDAWFMGFSPYLLTGVYVGFDEVQPMGKYETGSRAACPIWVEYRKMVEEDYPVQDFKKPAGIVMARIDAENGLLAGPDTEKSYFLPFKAGTQPTEISAGKPKPGRVERRSTPEATVNPGEDLLKNIF